MKLKNSLTTLSVLALASFAQAAEVRIGAQMSGLSGFYTGVATGVLIAEAGVHASVQGPLGSGGWQLRQVVEGGGFFATDATGNDTVPVLRLDTDLLRYGGTLYYGGGLGSGVLFVSDPLVLVSPLVLANLHAVVGKNFGNYSVEGVARLGLVSGVSIRASFPIR